jgi:uncharacterized membrane protein YqhA
MWRKILENGKAIALLPSLSLFLGAVFLGFYGIYILFETIYKAFTNETARDSTVLVTKFISVMDIHLISVILYIFAVGLYELFVLILAITFTKNLVEWKNPLDTLLFGLAVSAVIAVLILYYKIESEH